MSNKNKRKSSLTIAIIILSLSFLPLNDNLSSILLLFSAEPVFAHSSAQGNIGIDNEASTTTTSITAEQATNFADFDGGRVDYDRQDNLIMATGSSLHFEDESVTYGQDQVSSIPFSSSSSSSSSSTMDFDLFLDSFANSIFNGTSTFGGVGTSIINGIEVSGITIDKSQNRLSVILSNTGTEVGIDNNITGTETTTASTSPTTAASNSVSIIAMRIPINIADILSMAAASSNDNVLDNATGDIGENQDDSFSSDSFSPFSLLSNLQIGSSILIDVDWSEPQMVTMDLVAGSGSRGTSQEQEEQPLLNSYNITTADFVLVSVIPYTGLVNNNTMSSATR
ncbi:MAG: hypothetical protein M3136_09690 [Thermoproteota archaeon]|nr:hypothetical protein [Thermoproteota archaeon]